MSYLNALRLHFAGTFQANVSTVNNDPGHFQNDVFMPSYQEMGSGATNGWFNPQGDGGWRLMGCKVTGAWTPKGKVSHDPVLDYLVADSDQRVCGKLVDLDPEQQLVSEIWGLQVRICNQDGDTLLRSRFEVAPFMDIWDRATAGGGGDIGAGAMYQSRLKDLEWGDVSGSAFLTALKAAASDGFLSIKFNVDGLNADYTSPDFMCGRIVGTIGPAAPDEPKHMLIGRQFMATGDPKGNFFTPAGGINFFAAVVDEASEYIYLDLGNALSTAKPGGNLNDLGDLTLAVYEPGMSPTNPAGSFVELGRIPSSGEGGYASDKSWYHDTAGIVALPISREQAEMIANKPLALYVAVPDNAPPTTFISEPSSGAFVRADDFVYRLSPEDNQEIVLVATQFGRRLPNVEVTFEADSSQLQPGNYIGGDVPPVAVPLSALGDISTRATTNDAGIATITLHVGDPGQPRNFAGGKSYGIDGQVYGLRPQFTDQDLNPEKALQNQWNFVSILLWSKFTVPESPTWEDVESVFQQSANLYPVMSRFLNLGDYDAVVSHTGLLKLAFGLPVEDPNYMPVTRDLSPAKKETILKWLNEPKPRKTPVREKIAVSPSVATQAPSLMRGGKSAAAALRLCKQI